MYEHIGAFRIELLSQKIVKIELLDDNNFKKIRSWALQLFYAFNAIFMVKSVIIKTKK
jgi:hypothetical protein